jgi:hypothetical protein
MRALRTAFFLAVPVFIVAACGGTTKTKGQLMVSVQTDMAMPKDIDTLGLYVFSGGAVVFGDDFKIGTDVKLPATMGIVEGNTPGATVRIRLLARKNNQLIVMTEVTTTVPEGRLALLRMPMQWLCTGQASDPQGATDLSDLDEGATSNCGGTQQCVAGECVEETVDSSKLPDFDPTLVFGGAAAPDENGTCFDTLGCFASGFIADVDATDCTIPKPSGGAGLNVALEQSASGAGICGPEACLIPLDQTSNVGWTDLGNGRLQLPQGVCDQLTKKTFLGVAVTTSCTTKTAAIPTCGPWNSSSNNLGTTDAGAPSGSLGAGDGGVETFDASKGDGIDSGPPATDSGTVCNTFSGIDESACDPIAQSGCPKNEECAVNPATNVTFCTAQGTGAQGANCGEIPCGPGLYCLSNVCEPYCCSNEECPSEGGVPACAEQTASGAALFGVCLSPQ